MAALELTLAMTRNPRSEPVLAGLVGADGIRFRSTVASAPDIFWRQLHAQEFDVSEMSLSSLLIVTANVVVDISYTFLDPRVRYS